MNPIDAAGNILNEKDYVAVHIGDKVLTGVISKIKESSVVMAKGNEMLPGFVLIQVPINFVYNNAMPKLAQIYKLVKPPGFDTGSQA